MDYIKEGDIVTVDFNHAQFTLTPKAKVVSRPYNIGDPWVFKDVDTGDLFNVTEGCTITRQDQ